MASIILEKYIYRLIEKQFEQMMRQQSKVLADRHPEPLHQMRVNARRLRSTLELFESIVVMPKGYKPEHLRQFSRILGGLRNLDVLVAQLQKDYYPKLPSDEQKYLDRCFKHLQKKRQVAFKSVKQACNQQSFSQHYVNWLQHPDYTNIATRSLHHTLPHLLLPRLAQFLAHPGWLISSDTLNIRNQEDLHDLRKVLKHLRYQIEGFQNQSGEDNAEWITALKRLQDCLGRLQDLWVLDQMINDRLPKSTEKIPQFTIILQQQQASVLDDWELLRQPYQQPQYQYQCYQRILRSLQF